MRFNLAGLSLSSIRQALAPPEDATSSVAAGLVAILGAFWNIHVVLLLILVVIGGVIDLWTGARRARIRSRLGQSGGFDRAILDEGASGKGVILVALLFLGISIDSVGALLGDTADLGFEAFFRALTPATAALLAYRLAREMSSIKENIEATPGGRDTVWPGVRKFIDALRFQLSHPGEGALPEERWDDHIKPEERAWIEQQLGEYRARRPASDGPTV